MDPIAEDSSIVKKKRTKRQKSLLLSPPQQTATSSSTSAEYSVITTEEEEDIANFLILLAQGPHKTEHSSFIYECKTCNKCFPSFQALGGHRASHKKPKLLIPSSSSDQQKEDLIQMSMNSVSLQVSAKRIHECAICRAEFGSGQALGGHMRRHRPSNLHEGGKIDRNLNGISLDLNLPPPCDHQGDVKISPSSVSKKKMSPFSFGSQTPILMLASSLVNCHY